MAILVWIGFLGLIGLLLLLDLGVFHRRDHVFSISEALGWTVFWIALALSFNVFVFALYEHHWLGFGTLFHHELTGSQAAVQFLTGFVLEKSLSVDNLFVIAMVFAHFRVPLALQHRVLFWGILGALVLRGAMIAAGAALITRFDWVVYLFGGLLLVTAVRLMLTRHDTLKPEKTLAVRWLQRVLPVTDDFHGAHFFVRQAGKLAATPLLVALLVVETTDVIFAVDSIPAVFAVTRDPFLIFTSNVFAILGLRSLYFALAGLVERFRHLKASLVFLLAFVGVKMLLSHQFHIPAGVTLAFIAGILGVGVIASMTADRDPAHLRSPLGDELDRLGRIGLRQGKRVVVLVVGSTVLVVGIAMIILPGPALLVIPAGLSILAVEFVWARRWLARLRRTARRVGATAKRLRRSHGPGKAAEPAAEPTSAAPSPAPPPAPAEEP
jgi:tellurite resistance protein TerC